jgi:hypothetical protein
MSTTPLHQSLLGLNIERQRRVSGAAAALVIWSSKLSNLTTPQYSPW